MTILYFTATGNCLYIAKSIGNQVISIPQMIKENNYSVEDKEIGIVFPVYAWIPPILVTDFLKKCSFHCDYLFAIATYGIFSGGVANYLIESLPEKDFHYINKIKMVDNYLPTFNMEQQIKTEPKKKIEDHLSQIKSDIEEQKHFILPESLLVKTMSKKMGKLHSKEENPKNAKRSIKMHSGKGGIAPYYSVDENCIQCGVCVKVCPVDNIRLEGKNISLDHRCFMCLACVQNCPKKAIHLRGEASDSRYRNHNITLNEIIESNQ